MIFGFFKKETPEEKAEKERQEASIKSLQSGGLPLRAQERLKQLKNESKLFTSDLSCNEMLLVEEAGHQPIAQVMGSAFVNIAFLGTWTARRSTGELTDRSKAMLMARELAVSRMKQEAQALDAHGVIGVKFEIKKHSWASSLIECTAIGTAIKIPGRSISSEPFTSHLSGQDFWQLYQSGHWPLTLVMGVSCYYVFSDLKTRDQLNNWWGANSKSNQEIHQYTQGFHTAYNNAIAPLNMQATEAGAEGVVGTTVEHNLEEITYESSSVKHHDVLITVAAVGTAIRADDMPHKERTYQPLVIMNVKKGAATQAATLAAEQYATDLSDNDDSDEDTDTDTDD
jgi:uncharacterized protein YbjQ (UPF0145 family)